MSFLGRVSGLFLLTLGVFLGGAWAAQGPEPAPQASEQRAPKVLTEQQKRGQGLYLQYCPLCHIGPTRRFQKAQLGVPVISHKGLFRRENPPTEEAVRQRILDGNPGTMPAFRYTLEPNDVDDIIAYLKTL